MQAGLDPLAVSCLAFSLSQPRTVAVRKKVRIQKRPLPRNGYISHSVSIGYLIVIKELDSVVLTTDLPEHGLAKDDIGTVVLVHEGGKGCTVEFMTLAGKTLAVVTLLGDQIRQIAKDEIAHARHVVVAA